MLLESSEKTLQATWAAAKPPSPMSSILLLWKAGQHVGNRRRPPHKMTDSFARFPRPTGSREPPNFPKSGVVLWGKKSLLQPPFVVSRRWASVAYKPATKLLLNCKHKLKWLQWANMHKDAQRMVWTMTQKSFLATNPSFAPNLVIEELWFGELKMSATIRLVWRGPWSSQLL